MNREELSQIFKPIADGLFGKQRTSRYEKERHVVRRIEDMLYFLLQINDTDWGKYAFSREPLNGKFNDEQRKELTQKANECGREYAQYYKEKYGTKDSAMLARKLGMKVHYMERPQNAERVLFAEFRVPDQIYIYTDALKKAEETLENTEAGIMLGDKLNISRLLLAHELFHFIEERNSDIIFTKTQKVELWAPKPFHNRSGIMVLGEIAAMAFARELIGIKYSPYVMDVFLVYGYSPEEASGLFEEIMGYVQEVPVMI